MYCGYCWLYQCSPCCPKYRNKAYFVAIGDSLHPGSATLPCFHRELGKIAQANTTADILIEDQLRPPLNMVTVDQEREFCMTNS